MLRLVLRTQPRSGAITRAATISRDTGRVQLCVTDRRILSLTPLPGCMVFGIDCRMEAEHHHFGLRSAFSDAAEPVSQPNTLRIMNQIIAAFTLISGIAFGVFAWVVFQRKKAKLALCQRTVGEVIEVREHHRGGEGGPTKHPIIRYQAGNGETLTFESVFGSSNWKVQPGDRLDILVNENNPADAEVVGFLAQWGLPLVLGIVSLVSIIGAPIVYLVLKP